MPEFRRFRHTILLLPKSEIYDRFCHDTADIVGAWTASIQNAGQFIAIDFGKDYIVTKVMTQGRQGSDEYVIEFTIEYSADNKTWTEYTNEFGITEVSEMLLVDFIECSCLMLFPSLTQNVKGT